MSQGIHFLDNFSIATGGGAMFNVAEKLLSHMRNINTVKYRCTLLSKLASFANFETPLVYKYGGHIQFQKSQDGCSHQISGYIRLLII